MSPSLANSWLRKAITVAFGVTAFFYLDGVAWEYSFSNSREIEALFAYAMAVAIAYLPYYVLPALLRSANKFPRLQLACFVVTVGFQFAMFVHIRRGSEPSNGWEYVLVPFMQLGVELLLYVVVKIASDFAQAVVSKKQRHNAQPINPPDAAR